METMKTFFNKYSDWYTLPGSQQSAQYTRLQKLIIEINKTYKEEVTRAKDKHNLRIRSILSDRIGLSLIAKSKNLDDKESSERGFIPIKIVDRAPNSLLNVLLKYDSQIVELLLHYRGMQSTLKELRFQWSFYESLEIKYQKKCSRKNIEKTIDHFNVLINKVEKSGILQAIQNLGPDVMGSYFINEHRIELYWICIALFSILNNVSVEEFTIVILIHELAHGYTHIGFDKDGKNWKTEDFGNAELNIVEGFAQIYTELLCKDYFTTANSAFNSLLTKQATEYTSYKKWFARDEKDIYEKARRLLLTTRTNSIGDEKVFLKNLNMIKKDFDNSPMHKNHINNI